MPTSSDFAAMVTAAAAASAADIEAKMRDAYLCGRRDERRAMIDQLMRGTAAADMPALPSAPTEVERAETMQPVPVARAAPGTIRPIVHEILRNASPHGLTKPEIARLAFVRGIAPSSIANELQRNEAVKRNKRWLYRRKKDHWSLYNEELPETEGPAVASDDRPAGSTLNRSHQDERSIATVSGPAE